MGCHVAGEERRENLKRDPDRVIDKGTKMQNYKIILGRGFTWCSCSCHGHKRT